MSARVEADSDEARVARLTAEPVALVEYDPEWSGAFEAEAMRLRSYFPPGSIQRIEHIGSTSVPGMPAKPIVDVLVGVEDLDVVRDQVAPLLEGLGYEYFWRPTHGDAGEPFYAWFIKRDSTGMRTHHIHVVEMSMTEHWDRVLFRDYLIAHPDTAEEYAALKRRLAAEHPGDRVAYTEAKTGFITGVVRLAKDEAAARE